MAEILGIDKNSDQVLGWHDDHPAGRQQGARDLPPQGQHDLRQLPYVRSRPIDGMPPELAALPTTPAWLEAMYWLLPPLRGAGCVLVPSTTGRVRLNGAPISTKPAFHWLVHVEDPGELDRVWPQLLVKSFATMLPGTQVPLGFLRPSTRATAPGAWSHTSRGRSTTRAPARPSASSTTASREVIGAGLTVDPPDVRLIEGGRVDLQAFQDVTLAEERAAERCNIRIERRKAKPGARAKPGATAKIVHRSAPRCAWTSSSTPRTAGRRSPSSGSPAPASSGASRRSARATAGRPTTASTRTASRSCSTPPAPPIHAAPRRPRRAARPGVRRRALWAGRRSRKQTPVEDAFARIRRIGAACGRHGWSHAEIDDLAAKLAKEFGHVFTQKGAKLRDDLAKLLRAEAKVAPPPAAAGRDPMHDRLREYNETYGAALFGSKFAIVRERRSELGWEPEFLAAQRLRASTSPTTTVDDEPVFEAWMKWQDRNTFEGVVLEPSLTYRDAARPIQQGGTYNVWQGYGYRPVPGDCQPLLDHVRDVWCAGRDDAYDAIMNHMAAMVQRPELTGLPIVALVGEKEGAGKNIIIENIFLPLYGTHAIILDRPDALTGRFNSHLGWCVFLCANEAIWGGDKQREGAYKTVFTDVWRPLEKKFRDIVMVRNYTKAFALSNNEWFAPISVRDRRHLVLDVVRAPRRRRRLLQEAAQAHRRRRPRGLPRQAARPQGRLRPAPPPARPPLAGQDRRHPARRQLVDRFLHELLSAGEIPSSPFDTKRWPTQSITIGRTVLHNMYIAWCREHAYAKPETQTAFGRRAYDVFKDVFIEPDKQIREDGLRIIEIKPLPAAREAFATALDRPELWPDP